MCIKGSDLSTDVGSGTVNRQRVTTQGSEAARHCAVVGDGSPRGAAVGSHACCLLREESRFIEKTSKFDFLI